MSDFDDVGRFNAKFNLPNCTFEFATPHPLTPEVLAYRIKFMIEELAEYAESQGVTGVARKLRETMNSHENMWVQHTTSNLADGVDALADLSYVAMGTAHFHHFYWPAHWDEVQRANMAKVSGLVPKRNMPGYDVMKPEGWVGPDHQLILRRLGVDEQYL